MNKLFWEYFRLVCVLVSVSEERTQTESRDGKTSAAISHWFLLPHLLFYLFFYTIFQDEYGCFLCPIGINIKHVFV